MKALHEAAPVAWYYVEDPWGANEWHFMTDSPESQECDPRDWTPLYAAPQVPLTEARITAIANELAYAGGLCNVYEFARAIERAHGIGK